jgi:hypothetical protein
VGVALAVVGVNVYSRSQDKRTVAGRPGLVEGLGGMVGRLVGK